jgi:hypothetical protein
VYTLPRDSSMGWDCTLKTTGVEKVLENSSLFPVTIFPRKESFRKPDAGIFLGRYLLK